MGEWTYKLCGCFDNCGLCIKAFILPCVIAGQNAEKVGRGSCLMCGIASMIGPCGAYFMAKTREATRESKGIDGSFLNDCCTTMFCVHCSNIQVARELEGSPMGQSMSRI